MSRFCLNPFIRAHLAAGGNVYVCCRSWMGISLGNIFESDFSDIWNSETAKTVRESILDGSFRFCRGSVCPRIVTGEVERETIPSKFKAAVENKQWRLDTGPEHLSLNYDNSCNLHCKSCRKRIKAINDESAKRIIAFQDSLLDSDLFKGVHRVVVTGAGEPFASKVFMDFFQKLDESKHPQLKITLRTNGILLTPENWERIKKAHYAIDAILVSIDAARKKTYQILRPGGDFDKLLVNLEFLKRLKKNKNFKIGFNFVVQEQNFREMSGFVKFARRLSCDEVTFTQLMDLGTYSREEYSRLAVHQPGHPQFPKLKKILRQSIFRSPIVFFNNLSHLLKDEK